MRDQAETSFFTTVPTALVGEDACVLYVKESDITASTVRTRGMTLSAFMPIVDKEDAVMRGFGEYVLTKQGDLQDGYRAFWFAKQRSPEEITTAYDTEEELRLGISWPAVLTTVNTGNLLAYTADGDTYVASTVWKFVYGKPAYDGPTKVLVEYFASHTKFTLGAAEGMQPMGGTLDYGIGSVSFPPCLHGNFRLTYEIPENHPNYPGQGIYQDFAATTPPMRPTSFVLRDGYRFENGLYIRRRETAFAPP
jgi:hypothetical protein